MIYAVANQKGGVGKTTTAVNLSAVFAQKGYSVLLIDLDPQGNATVAAGVELAQQQYTLYDVLVNAEDIKNVIVPSAVEGLHILPSDRHLSAAEIELVHYEKREYLLKKALSVVLDQYSFVFIDCPPTLSLLTLNALCAANRVLIPMQCEFYALSGLSDLIATLRRVKQGLNPALEIEGLIRTMYDPRSSLAQQVSEQLNEHFEDKVLKTAIPRNIRLAEAPSFGLPGVVFDNRARGSRAYWECASELEMRCQKIHVFDER